MNSAPTALADPLLAGVGYVPPLDQAERVMGQGSPTVGGERTLAGASRDQNEEGRAQPLPVVRSTRPGFPCASRRRGVRSPPDGFRV